MVLVEQLMELGKEQIPAVTGMVRLTSLNQFCPQSVPEWPLSPALLQGEQVVNR